MRDLRRTALFAVIATSFAFVTLATACGPAKTPTTAKASGDGGAEAGAANKLVVTPPPSGLPPMAAMPPPGVAGSKKAKLRADDALGACAASASAQAKDPAAQVKKTGDGCGSKMKPSGALMKGTQADKDAHQDNKFRAEANKCYRIYFAAEESVKDAVIVMRDSNGDVVAEAPAPAVPQNGSACFTTADEVSVSFGVGSGKGAWAAQVYSD